MGPAGKMPHPMGVDHLGLQGTLPRLPWHHAPHEFVEHWRSECGVAMTWAPYHAFIDQLAAGGGQRGHVAAQHVGNVSRTMRARAKLGHRPHIPFL